MADRAKAYDQIPPSHLGFRLQEVQRTCNDRHDKHNERAAMMEEGIQFLRDRVILLTGPDGKNGAIGELRKESKDSKAERQELFKRMRNMELRIAAYFAGAITVLLYLLRHGAISL